MTPFELAEPSSLNEVVTLLGTGDTAARAIAGGTGLMRMMKAG